MLPIGQPAYDQASRKRVRGGAGTAGVVAPAASRRKARGWRRSRKAARPALSLANRWLSEGREIVPAEGNRSPAYLGTKRVLDVVGAVVLLAAFSPVMLATWLVLMVTTRGKPIFRQERLGYRGRPFAIYKFRTMVLDATKVQHRVENEKDGPIFKNCRDPRITRIGRFLRSTSIDEFPQLLNVLAGQMTLVGPRPPLAKEVAAEGSFDGILNTARQYDNRDWYPFTPTESTTIDIGLAVAPTADTSIRLNVFGDALMVTVDVEPGGSGTATVDVVADTTYTMQLGAGGQAAYTVTFG